ncbi:hypothetical protein PMG11_01569 [Penicillium brasilianum]|uniref:F-box domain-containing protein n=1 Tax=Penicillium brasilianum TaxID=104259 RepID=A0A0F7TFL6_PENBI|nr:hypothetical protein PMG11_01569 [Penicillium brasilianum]
MNLQSFPTELLEAILSLVDIQTLLLAQRVSCQWANCIQESPQLQQTLFFQPAPTTTPRQQNPLLKSKFPYWFPADDHKSCSISFGAGDMQDFLESSETHLRPEASWRRMLVQQPPILTLGWVERGIAVSDMVDLHRWEVPVQAFGGLRMNMLYDIVVNSSETAPEYFYFRVLWSRYGTFAHEWCSLKSDPDPSIHGERVAEALRNGMQSADVLLDVWHAQRLPFHILHPWRQDTWTWDLVQGLRAPMGDLGDDLVHDLRELKEVNGWSLSTEISAIYTTEIPTCGGYIPELPDDDDWDL